VNTSAPGGAEAMKVVESIKFFKGREGRFWAMVLGAVAFSALLAIASQFTADEAPRSKPVASMQVTDSLFAGVRQEGAALGSPDAPLTLTEYADLQCPYCAQWANETLPVLVRDYVKTGRLRIVFRGLAFVGPDSDKALRAVHAAGRQNRLWDVMHHLYARQGAENSGWVSDHLLAEVAERVDGLDLPGFRRASAGDFDATIRRDLRAAQDAGVQGTPAFELALNGEAPELLSVTSLGPEGLVQTLDAWLEE
jgi:protein-disulfide isomerase